MTNRKEGTALPCPFCGSEDISDGEILEEMDGHTWKQSECQDCGAIGPRASLFPGQIDYGDVKAIEAWNRRAALKGGEEKDVSSGSIGGDEPPGWKLVPIEPTREMCLAEWNVSLSDAHTEGGVSECVWAAMLAAAPRFVSTGEPREPDETTPKEGAQSSAGPAKFDTPEGFIEWFGKNYYGEVVFHDPAWHARSIFRTAVWHYRALSTASPQHAADDVSSGSGASGGAELPPLPLPEPIKPAPMYCGCGEEFPVNMTAPGGVLAYAPYREWRCAKCGGTGPFTSKLTLSSAFPVPTYTAAQMQEYARDAIAKRFASTDKTLRPNDPKSGSTASLSHDTPES